jgi:hypothetical protein
MRGNCEECSGNDAGTCECAPDVVVQKFYGMVDTLRNVHRLNVTDMIVENSACLLSRMAGTGGGERKKDCIFWDGDRPESVQNFMFHNSKPQSTGKQMVFIHHGKKRALAEVFSVQTKNTIEWMEDPNKAGHFEWKTPTWAPKSLAKTRRVWCPQEFFKPSQTN